MKRTEEKKEAILKLKEKGLSLRQIQEKTKIHYGTIHYHLNKDRRKK